MHVCRSLARDEEHESPAGPAPMMRTSTGDCREVFGVIVDINRVIFLII